MVASKQTFEALIPSGEFVRLAAPVSPMARVRFRKDVLRVGRVVVDGGAREFDCTPETLQVIKRNFDLATARGNRIPLVWGHPKNANDPRDNCGEVESLEIVGDSLFATIWTTETDAAKLSSGVSDQVSVCLDQQWVDGQGNTYSPMLTHLGIVNLPVVAGQGPMIRLSLSTLSESKNMRFFKGKMKAPITLAASDTGGDDTMSVADVATLINECFGVAIPGDVSTVKELTLVLKAMTGAEAAEGETTAPEEAPVLDGSGSTDPNAQAAPYPMSTKGNAELAALRKEIAELKSLQLSGAKKAYETVLDTHIAAGKIAPAHKEVWVAAGESKAWSLSTLDALEAAPATIPMNRKAVRMGTGVVPGDNAKAKAEAVSAEQSKIMKQWGLAEAK